MPLQIIQNLYPASGLYLAIVTSDQCLLNIILLPQFFVCLLLLFLLLLSLLLLLLLLLFILLFLSSLLLFLIGINQTKNFLQSYVNFSNFKQSLNNNNNNNKNDNNNNNNNDDGNNVPDSLILFSYSTRVESIIIRKITNIRLSYDKE